MAPQGSNPSVPMTEQVKEISCWMCGRKFKKQKYLNSHLSYYHSTPCDSCGTAILGNTCRIHQRSCENTEETEIEIVGTAERPDVNLAGTDTEGLQSEFVATSNEGLKNELVRTGTEDPEIEFIGEVSGKKSVEKYFPMGDEEHQENLDSIVGLAVPIDNHATNANSGPHGGQSIPNGVHQMHHGGYPIHNGVYQMLHEGFPIHNGGHPMYFDGQSMQLGQNRTFVPMNNYRQMAAPTQNNRIKKSSFKGKLKMWRDKAGRLQLKRS